HGGSFKRAWRALSQNPWLRSSESFGWAQGGFWPLAADFALNSFSSVGREYPPVSKKHAVSGGS
ncbi:MAG: hypothetical protein NTZ15_12515, partial [Burkholderiales bacterium]|nr:hypothetical protein [Burkholderiales bacterium]